MRASIIMLVTGPHLNIYTQREIRKRERWRQWDAIQAADPRLGEFLRELAQTLEARLAYVDLNPPPRGNAITVREIFNPPRREGVYYLRGDHDD